MKHEPSLRLAQPWPCLGLTFGTALVIGPAAQAEQAEPSLELFGSLMDNACKWARRTVVIGIEDAAVGRVMIEDDGPGCAPERTRELGRRTHRLDESTAGHGLGLAIAGDIVKEYGGHLEFDRSPSLGALRVQVYMPAIAEG